MNTKPAQPAKKALVRVLGCKVNQAEAAAMAKILEAHGYEIDAHAEFPDLVVVNTCCVTQKAEGKSRRMVGRLSEKFPSARLVVTGCLAQIDPASVQAAAGSSVSLSMPGKDRFEEYVTAGPAGSKGPGSNIAHSATEFADLGAAELDGRARSFLKVQDGCSQKCTYCIVPQARGPSRSLPPEKVLAHCRNLDAARAGEIVLTGIHLGAYGRDLDPAVSLDELLQTLLEASTGMRFRLSSIEPQEITPRLIELAARHPRVCRHFHIPLQSGDDEILRRMRRPYDSTMIRDLVKRITLSAAETCIGFDVMVGFPGEDDHSFRRTVALIQELHPAYLHVFPFSPRPGTPAAVFTPRVPENVARERVEELRDLSKVLRTKFYECFVGATLNAVAESEPDRYHGTLRVRTDNYVPVIVHGSPATLNGRAFPVTLQGVIDGEVHGTYPQN